MSITLAGILISCSGMAVVAMVIFGVLPEGNPTLEYTLIAIGWVFILFGVWVRWYGMKKERELEEKKKQLK